MTSPYEFERGVDIPAAAARSGVNIDLLRAMPVNTSFWFPKKDEKKVVRFYRVAKKLGCTILVRKVDKTDPKGAGVRMWKMSATSKAPLDPIAAAEKAARRRPTKTAARKKKPGGKKGTKKPAPKKAGNGAARPKKRATKKRAVKGVAATGEVGGVEVSVQ